MRKDGYVSLWIGNVLSEENLNEILEIPYNEDVETSNHVKNFHNNPILQIAENLRAKETVQ